jgi:hypothetical protein
MPFSLANLNDLLEKHKYDLANNRAPKNVMAAAIIARLTVLATNYTNPEDNVLEGTIRCMYQDSELARLPKDLASLIKKFLGEMKCKWAAGNSHPFFGEWDQLTYWNTLFSNLKRAALETQVDITKSIVAKVATHVLEQTYGVVMKAPETLTAAAEEFHKDPPPASTTADTALQRGSVPEYFKNFYPSRVQSVASDGLQGSESATASDSDALRQTILATTPQDPATASDPLISRAPRADNQPRTTKSSMEVQKPPQQSNSCCRCCARLFAWRHSPAASPVSADSAFAYRIYDATGHC